MKKFSVFSFQFSVQLLVCSLLLLLFAVGCIPAGVPENLDDTPGPAVVVTDREYIGHVFSARYPAGWRIVTGEASQPQSVIFVAPDEVSTIQLRVGHLEEAAFPADRQTDVRAVMLDDGTTVTAILTALPENFDSLAAIFEAVIESVHAS